MLTLSTSILNYEIRQKFVVIQNYLYGVYVPRDVKSNLSESQTAYTNDIKIIMQTTILVIPMTERNHQGPAPIIVIENYY